MSTYTLVCGSTKGQMPHFPTEEMVRLHHWHVYVKGSPTFDTKEPMLVYTGTREECEAYVSARKRDKRNKLRRERDQAMRDLGLKKVKGALGRVYWE